MLVIFPGHWPHYATGISVVRRYQGDPPGDERPHVSRVPRSPFPERGVTVLRGDGPVPVDPADPDLSGCRGREEGIRAEERGDAGPAPDDPDHPAGSTTSTRLDGSTCRPRRLVDS